MTKTVKELEQEIRTSKLLDHERTLSNRLYARKEFEKALIWLISIIVSGIILTAISSWLIVRK